MSPIEHGLPHRAPFIFIDSVLEGTAGERAVCGKVFAPEEPFFAGHFPGDPIVPGVILTEALAQTAGIAAGRPGRMFHLSAIRQMKFLRAVRPGENLRLEATVAGEAGGLVQCQVVATVNGERVAEGAVVLSEVARGE